MHTSAVTSAGPLSAPSAEMLSRAPTTDVPFARVLTDLVQDTQGRQAAVSRELERIVSGEATGVHDLVVSMAQADLAFRMVLEIRDRLIASYHEIMRMQV